MGKRGQRRQHEKQELGYRRDVHIGDPGLMGWGKSGEWEAESTASELLEKRHDLGVPVLY